MARNIPSTYDAVALSVLVYEFSFSKKSETDAKIKSRLKRRKLGAFDEARIQFLRKLKDELQQEIGKQAKSHYYVKPSAATLKPQTADLTDFDIARLTSDLISRHPEVPEREIGWFVPFATFIYHLL